VEREAFTELCADRPREALRLYDALLAAYPGFKLAQTGVLRTLERLGRYDEAISRWRVYADSTTHQLMDALAHAHGASGYWTAKHVEGRGALAALRKEQALGFVAPHRMMLALFFAGDMDGGFKTLDTLVRDKDQRLYHLPCLPGVDEVRQMPRFKAIAQQVGGLPAR
jgi:hypothetical protein